ncbi:hypothetical protein SDRG_13295 [Saprolegnia diclina VS20]|uniref:Ubiquitin-like domain-containing protein n=1 Tax=Saprolegnia diclina (strain VS20) TaxID=1156394 RepID=T0RA24_SAPDV|nr:hypothetical protein SDRG_13295 [Saprolegnia diclina VS20]EQC28958.1 hypothetical protein SDRG_13295 [Saprolegnia diclina VS20]|eukprot:XP_008617597.1 hypothetical protein SDRG_13295 [Saprolegnia diclina VS20]
MEVGWTRVVSAQLDGLLCVEDDELTPTMTVADLKELLRSKLKALGVGVRINPKLIFYDTKPNDSDEITPLMPTLRTGICAGATITLDVLLYSPVYETMQGILKKENIPTDQQRLIYAGMQLEQGRTLEDYGWTEIHAASRPPRRTMRSARISSSAPSWRTFDRGLNIHGKCTNEACMAFNVLAHSAPCPICKQAIEARSCGFYACEWRYEAFKVGSGMHMSSDWNNMVLWRALLLLVKPLRDEPKCALCKDAIGETTLCKDAIGEMTLECKTTCGHMHRGCVDAWVAGSMQRLSVGANCPKCHTSVA